MRLKDFEACKTWLEKRDKEMKSRRLVSVLVAFLMLPLVLSLVVALASQAEAEPSLNSVTPPDGYEAQPTPERYGHTSALLIQDTNPWNGTANMDALNNMGISYDVINSSNLPGRDLSVYSFIMYASDQPTSYYSNLQANISGIEDFVSGGGLLIAHVSDRGWQGGNWAGMHILPNNVQKVSTANQDLVIVDTEHPIIRGTPPGNFDIYATNPDYFDNWNYSTHGYLNNVPASSNVIIEVQTGGYAGQPTYIEYPFGLGKVLATMQTVEWGYNHGFGVELLRNELRYANHAPDITVSPTYLDFMWTLINTSSSPQTVTITNDGNANLNIGSVSLSGTHASLFSLQSDNASNQTLSPGADGIIRVVFSPTTITHKEAILSIPSDDPDENLVNVKLHGIGKVIPEGVGGEIAPINRAGVLAFWLGLVLTLALTIGAGSFARKRHQAR